MLNELELLTKCELCVYRSATPSEGWCYLFKDAPTAECARFVLNRDAQTINGINMLERMFPDRFNDD